MSTLHLAKINKTIHGEIIISGSKSETNRLLILQQLFSNLIIKNASDSDDSKLLQQALNSIANEINIGHAGTAMRFLTAYFACKENHRVVLTGSERMKNRPIKILVEALLMLGADIKYLEKEGFPPLKITGKKITNSNIEIEGNVSSQYISALLLIAAKLPNGLTLKFKGEVTSVPYIKMTLSLLKEIGINWDWKGNAITIFPKSEISSKTVIVESDWSSASYFYSLVALNSQSKIKLHSYKKNSLQGDAVLQNIYKKLGVETSFNKSCITIKNTGNISLKSLNLNLNNAPDIAQTIAVTCFGLGISCHLTGLHTLKIKETDRLVALKTELEKLGGKVSITEDSLNLYPSSEIHKNISIATYDDHRMAMAFAPLACKAPIIIQNPEVVSKSYVNFWNDLKKLSS